MVHTWGVPPLDFARTHARVCGLGLDGHHHPMCGSADFSVQLHFARNFFLGFFRDYPHGLQWGWVQACGVSGRRICLLVAIFCRKYVRTFPGPHPAPPRYGAILAISWVLVVPVAKSRFALNGSTETLFP